MDNLNLAIKEYLKKQTNYAVLISGKWGVGKTHYYKNVIEHSILNTSTYSDNSVKYKSVHISLFGLSSTEEIQTQIFLSIYPLLKNKAFKLSVGFGKAIARGIFAIKNLGDIDKYISDVKQKEEEWIDLERIVICFDDLERRSSKLPLDELIGFINTLVENNDAKIILIANEDKIKDDIYKDLKEKVIGVTVEFEADFKKNIDAIINSRYRPSFSSYANFLQNEIDLILEFSENLDNNLRVLIFTLDKLQYVYSEIKTKVLDLPSKKNSIIISKLEIIWRFTIATSIEYKKHLISYKNRNELDKSSNSDWSRAFITEAYLKKDSKIEIEKSYKEIFIEQYYNSTSDYKYFESIYSFVTGANEFSFNNLLNEVEIGFNIHVDEILPQYLVLNKLDYRNYFLLNDYEYIKLTKDMIAYAEKGKYKISEYLTIFIFAMRFDNLLRLDKKKLKNKLKNGLKKGKPNFEFVQSLGFHLDISERKNFLPELTEIRNSALKVNDSILYEREKNEALDLINKFYSNWSVFETTIRSDEDKWWYTPIFHYTSGYKVYLKINSMNHLELFEFSNLIRLRYNSNTSGLIPELQFLEILSDKVKYKSKTRKQKKLKNHFLNSIGTELDKAIIKLKQLVVT